MTEAMIPILYILKHLFDMLHMICRLAVSKTHVKIKRNFTEGIQQHVLT